MKKSLNVKDDTQVSAEGWRKLVGEYKDYYKRRPGKPFPEDPQEQLWGAIGAVFESWMGEKAVTYRRVEKITGLLGTAVNVVQMVFGNTGDNSGTGVCFTRDPSTGEKDFLRRFSAERAGRGRGRRNSHADAPERIANRDAEGLQATREACAQKLEKHYRDMQDMEFTVENGTLYMLQTRTGKRSPSAAFQIAVDMDNERLIKLEEALERIKAKMSSGFSIPCSIRRCRARKLPAAQNRTKESTQCRARRWGRRCSRPQKRRSGRRTARR